MLITALLAAAMAQAAPSTLDRCLASGPAAAGVVPATINCIDAEIARRDRLLNTVYRERLRRSDAAARRRLVAAERRWIGRRDAACVPGDTSQDAAVSARWCVLEQTDARIAMLRR